MGRRSSTRFALVAAIAAVAACIVSPVGSTASFSIVPGGSAVVVTVSPAGSTSNATFTGVAGHRISLNISNVTITSTKVSILKPDGTNLVTPFTVLKSGYWLDVKPLLVGGTYKILVDPKLDYTGKMTLKLYDVPADVGGSLSPGTPVSVATTVPGQNGVLTFSGVAGHRVAVNLTDSTYNSAKLRIHNPDTTLLFPTAMQFGHAGNFLEPRLLPDTGTYTLQIDPQLSAVGGVTVTIYDVPNDASAPITACTSVPCSPTTATTTSPGQNAGLTFSGTAGQRVSIVAGNSLYTSLIKVSLLKPDSTPLTSPPITVGGFDGFIEPQTLPANGTYTILVDPQLADVGSLDVQLYTVPVPPNPLPTITPGTPLTATTTVPGQNAEYTFSGLSTQRVSLNLSNVTYGSAKVSILKPDGTQLAPPLFVPNTFGNFVDPIKLPVNGTYRVKVDPQGASTGSTDIGLWVVPADITGPVTANNPTHVSITTPGRNAVLTYAGSSGQRITVELYNVTLGTTECCSAKIKITRPDGSTLATSQEFGTLGTYIDVKSLNANGTYKIWIDPVDESVGDLDLLLRTVPADAAATSGALTPNGTNVNVTTTAPGQGARVNFTATAGQRFAYKLVTFGGSFCDIKLALYDPNGTKLSGPTCAPNDTFFDTRVLPIGGTYKITLDPQGSNVGTASLTLYAVPPDVVTPLTGSAVSLSPGQNAYLSFSATSGQTATVTPSAGGTVSLARAALYKSDKTTQLAGGAEYWDPSGGNPVASLIPTTSPTYYLKYDPIGGASGTSVTFTLAFS